MVIETAVVGSLGLHILSNFRKGTSAGGNLPLEKLQLSAAPLHPITTPIPLDGPTLSQGEADLAEAEGLGEGDYLAFPLIHPNAHCLKTTHNLAGEFLQFFNIRQDDIVIIHVVGCNMHPSLAFYPVIHGARKGHHLLLGWLHTQWHTASRGRTGGACNDGISQGQELRVENELTVPLVKGSMGSIREEAFQVQQEHSPLAAIPAEMPVKLLLQSAVCPVEPFLFLGCPIVINHARAV